VAADFQIVIIGSGPAGLSAAAHAAKKGVKHVLLEAESHINHTIFKYQKKKLVMATPEILPLRSDLEFKEESREEVIDSWTSGTNSAGANIRFNAQVTSIKGQKGEFVVGLAGGETMTAESIVLAIGVQGNLNTLRVPGAEWDKVQYQLDDPDEYQGEQIAVIGVGDAGIENALALATNNVVSVINTADDFPRAKPANAALIRAAIDKGDEPGGMITIQGGHMVPLPFGSFSDPETGRVRIRLVDVESSSYRVAREYMIRLDRKDLGDPEKLRRIATAAGLSSEAFRDRYGYLAGG